MANTKQTNNAQSNNRLNADAMYALYRKNLETLANANKITVEALQKVTQLHTGYLRETAADINNWFSQTKESKTHEERLTKTQSAVQQGTHKLTEHSRGVLSAVSSSSQEAMNLLTQQFKKNMEETQNIFKKH